MANEQTPPGRGDYVGPDEFKRMHAAYHRCGAVMAQMFQELQARVPPPQLIAIGDGGFAFRYVEQLPHQAVVVKLARLVAGLGSATLLQAHGQLQDSGALRRVMDEQNDDIALICFGLVDGVLPALTEDLLRYFWQEEFEDPDDVMNSAQKRGMVSRDKVRAALANRKEAAGVLDQSTRVKSTRIVAKGYGGYVHGAAPHIMEMYGGDPPRFHLGGIPPGSPPWSIAFRDLQNYWYRGILSFGMAASAFGDAELKSRVTALAKEFDEAAGGLTS